MRRSAPRPLGPAVEALAAAVAPQTLLGEVQRRWSEVAGEALAREAEPVSERDGILTVACRSSVWAQELDLMSELLLQSLNAALVGGSIRRLRCVATPPPR